MSISARFACAWLLILLPVTSRSEWRIDPAAMDRLPAGAKAHATLKLEPDQQALRFSAGGLVLPTDSALTAAAGAVEVSLQTPNEWPVAEDRALFHAATSAHSHVTLFFRDAGLIAAYKGCEERFSAIRFPDSGSWKPGSWHRVQFGWQGAGEEVEFVLLVDDALAGVATGQKLALWPETCEVGVRSGRTPWRGLLRDIVLSDRRIPIPGLEPGERTITIHGEREEGDCYPFWTVGNYNKPHQFLNPKYAREIQWRQPFVHQANAVYLLGGRYRDQNAWFLGLAPDGGVRTDFTGLTGQLRGMLDGGLVPWPVLDNVPFDMSHPPQENTYGNTAPEADVRIWERYVEAALRAMVDAFGKDKVEQWWFRVGTEPDLMPGHWAGTREQWLAHYDHTVAAANRVIPGAKIGPGNILNPAGGEFGAKTRSQWGLDIIDHCALGRNAANGKVGTRMDWFSFSWYGRIGQPVAEFDQAVAAIRGRLNQYPQFAGLPLIVGEHAVLHDEGGRRLWSGETTEWSASFYAALADRVYRHGIQQVYEWAQTTGGVPHPRTQVIALLQDMSGGRRLRVDVMATSQADCGAIACRKNNDLLVLAYNHRPLRRPKVPERIHLVVNDTRMQSGASWTVTESRIDADHAVWAYAFAADCAAANLKPAPAAGLHEGGIGLAYGPLGEELFLKNRAKYAALAKIPITRNAEPLAVSNGRCELDLELPGHGVRLFRLTPPPP